MSEWEKEKKELQSRGVKVKQWEEERWGSRMVCQFWITWGNLDPESQQCDCTIFIVPYFLAASYGVHSASITLYLQNANTFTGC